MEQWLHWQCLSAGVQALGDVCDQRTKSSCSDLKQGAQQLWIEGQGLAIHVPGDRYEPALWYSYEKADRVIDPLRVEFSVGVKKCLYPWTVWGVVWCFMATQEWEKCNHRERCRGTWRTLAAYLSKTRPASVPKCPECKPSEGPSLSGYEQQSPCSYCCLLGQEVQKQPLAM